jgi:hypothetical protein
MRTASFSLLTILCLALTASAGTFFNDGGIDGNDNAMLITGPDNPNLQGTVLDTANGFVAAIYGTPNTLEFGEWIQTGFTPASVSYEIGTSAFGTDLGSGTVAQDSLNSRFLFSNVFGWDVYDVTIPVTSTVMTAGNTYWVSLSNASDAQGDDSTEAWDIPNGGLGGPATCNIRQSGINFGDCGLGGESFTLTSYDYWTTPEPSSILLFGSGILGIVGVLRRKLMR